ncbi:iron-hydroxamate ABC transporter substrate-binding protein [Paenibacillus pini]|uniref:Ferrichrome-binding periplasmic protein n=1 Tax=Paenibacillus pini JCM 16418 TaxID=1236976 RepID=W7Z1Y3_9BACL|nr:iron-hydroxamate ABC transporter substrate-binding protein [Paenibacillus pini]GAF08414.1 ferrichrome-binding periplasmic protein precursor [Paenibacillus pini JCM 16418]
MLKRMIPLMLLIVLTISGCNSGNTAEKDKEATTPAKATESKPTTITYQSENGPVVVPADPKRVVVLGTYAGDVLSLGVPIVGVDSWAKSNPRFTALKDVQEVSDESLEKIIELKPDLIIGLSNSKNVDKLKQIAPTVTYTYGKVDYLTQHLEIGKLLNKEKAAQAWIDDFKKRAHKAGEDIKAKIGENATVSVIENFDKQMYVFGDNWGRGTEILYQEMKLAMPKKVKEMTSKEGYYALSLEVLPQYAGDYLVFSKSSDTDNSFQQTQTYKNIPAVKNNHVFEANSKEFYFNDAMTLDYQLDFFIKSFLGE